MVTTQTRTTYFRAYGKTNFHIQRQPVAVNHRATGLCGFEAGGLGTKYSERESANVCRACKGAQG